MRSMAKILVVDDEPTLVATLDYNLRREGHEVVIARDGEAALAQAQLAAPDLVLLDVMLPKLDGFEVCRALRRDSMVPILLLTAKDSEIDKVVGLEIGADDYITKPFSMRELLARVKAQLRRSARIDGDARPAPGQVERAAPLAVAGIEIDPRGRTVERDGQRVHLKPKEFDLLAFLAQNRGHVFSRDQLLERVWGYAFNGDSRTVDVHVRWLREKLEDQPSQPKLIETVRGVGYRLAG
jgi:DNA-binding response OmpR family regulator